MLSSIGFVKAFIYLSVLCYQPPADSSPSTSLRQELSDSNQITEVVLYRKQARVTRRVSVPAVKGTHMVIVDHLPGTTTLQTLDVVRSQGLEVLGMKLLTDNTTLIKSPELQAIDAELQVLATSRAQFESDMQLLNKKRDYIDQLMNFTAQASTVDLQRGLLQSRPLEETVRFGMMMQTEFQKEISRVESELAILNAKQLELLNRSKQMVTRNGQFHRAEVMVHNALGEAAEFRIQYLVSGCGWSPQYHIHTKTGSEDFVIQKRALIEQFTGEDWNDIQLILSASTPDGDALGPTLPPFRVQIANGNRGSQASGIDYSDVSFAQSRDSRQAGRGEPSRNPLSILKAFDRADALQAMEIQAEVGQVQSLADDILDDVANQLYTLPVRVQLPSRAELQAVELSEDRLTGKMYYVATPLLSSFAYREADLVNTQADSYLRGPATIYLDEKLIGKMELPTVASGQHFIVGFGADPQVRTRRELLNKSDEVQGGNRVLRFEYRLVLANFHKSPVHVQLYDRLPYQGTTNEINCVLGESKFKISDNALYQRLQKPKGMLRWDLEVPAGAARDTAFDVDYQLTITFDRSKAITGLTQTQQQAFDLQDRSPSGKGSGMGMGGMGGMGGGGMGGGDVGGMGGGMLGGASKQ